MPGFSTLLTALGWSLLNSIWQLAVLWSFYFLITAGIKRISAAGKHNLALAFSMIGSGWVISTFFQLLNEPAYITHAGFIPVFRSFNYWVPYISILYIVVLTTRTAKYGLQYFGRRKKECGNFISPVLQSFVDRHARLLGISSGVKVYLSDLAETAETSGFLKPLILLPVSLMTRLSPQQLEAILIHELFHIRRNDYLINIFITCFQGILFFNPFAQLFYRTISRERENACDDEVLERGYAPRVYAEALFCLEKFRQVKPDFSIAADGHKPWLLMERIQRVLGNPVHKKSRLNPFLIFSLATSVGLLGLQQKTSAPDTGQTTRQALHVSVLPDKYEMRVLQIKTPEKETPYRAASRNKQKTKKITPLPSLPEYTVEMDNPVEEGQDEKLIFADNKVPRDFSNQQAAGTNEESIEPVPGTPYVPSVSLSYEAVPALTQADSIRNVAVQSRIMDMVIESRYRASVRMKDLQTEVAKNRQQLKRMEIKNHDLILQHRKNIKPLLENLQDQLKLKKLKIDQLKIQLRVSDTEIIHI
jgi:Zn-dependent protease with chaperone function